MNFTRQRWARQVVSAVIGLALGAATVLARAQADEKVAWDALRQGAVLLVRHANAPGVGDPADFKLGDCRTQRNLDQTGREQARQLGEQFASHQIAVGAVLTSQWCRTKETAEIAFPNRGREDASFNSFFGDSDSQPEQTAAALKILKQWKGPGALVVVTHQVNITASTGVVPTSSEGVVVRPKADGIDVVGRLTP
ncbi:histidine phosphatase family protein [Xylophilus sp. GOD-11R]|uniref:histidine phosphatase family protein n=1 Tax=Xylophilus sp. GOD-11R TaxID=3089814 RepID=UPI00298CB2D2|nr:histidine phosphatase family protein [Xylophilus sp. GOD-11R]WPB58346.1 histidine phosphatase family protein [Xylophilus sp. GOD-11R]